MRNRMVWKAILRCLGFLVLAELPACGLDPETDSAAQVTPARLAEPKRVELRALPLELQQAVTELGTVEELAFAEAGSLSLVRGSLGRLATGSAAQPDPQALAHVARAFGLQASDFTYVSGSRDERGDTHGRYAQVKNGLPVSGGDLVLHADAKGMLYAVNSTARASAAAPPVPVLDPAKATAAARLGMPEVAVTEAARPQLIYLLPPQGELRLCWRLEVRGESDTGPVHDVVFVDALSGELAARSALLHSVRNRKVYSANGTKVLPGALRRKEGDPLDVDPVVNGNYDRLGATYACYADLFGRDSFDHAGAPLVSSVHYGIRYNNAFWDSGQMVHGDGDGVTFGNFALSLDVTAHELTHAVTQESAGLAYSDESGALNESMSDVFASVCESYKNGAVDDRTWMLGEDVFTPATPGDALRYMGRPTDDGISRDYYPERYVGSRDYGGVHVNSGIANLAFYLVAQGGSHPRGKTRTVVPALGISKARQIWYRALTLYMTPRTDFRQAAGLTAQAASDLYGPSARDTVRSAWQAVGL